MKISNLVSELYEYLINEELQHEIRLEVNEVKYALEITFITAEGSEASILKQAYILSLLELSITNISEKQYTDRLFEKVLENFRQKGWSH